MRGHRNPYSFSFYLLTRDRAVGVTINEQLSSDFEIFLFDFQNGNLSDEKLQILYISTSRAFLWIYFLTCDLLFNHCLKITSKQSNKTKT